MTLAGTFRSQACTQLSHVQPGPVVSRDERLAVRVNFINVAKIFLRRSAAIVSSEGAVTLVESNDETPLFLRLTDFG